MIVINVVIGEFSGEDLRGGEWNPENRGSRKFLIRSRNLGSFCDESRSLVFHVFLSVSESPIFFARSRSLGFAFLAEVLWQKLSRWASRVSVAEIKHGVYANGGQYGTSISYYIHSARAHAHLIRFPLHTLWCWNGTKTWSVDCIFGQLRQRIQVTWFRKNSSNLI